MKCGNLKMLDNKMQPVVYLGDSIREVRDRLQVKTFFIEITKFMQQQSRNQREILSKEFF